jgi:hypothetical protein
MNALLSGSLLAASMLLGQTSTPEPGPKIVLPGPMVQPSQPAAGRGPILGIFQREDRPILNRIQGWFKRDQPDMNVQKDRVIRDTPPTPATVPATPASMPSPGTNDFPRKMPNPTNKAAGTQPLTPTTSPPGGEGGKSEAGSSAKPIEQTALIPTTGANAKAKNPIHAHLVGRVGRDENFEWITGQLEIENGSHVLYYATPDTLDKFNGRVVLVPQQVDLTQFGRGDLVCVHGQLVQSKTAQGMAPLYRVTMANVIERAKR